MRIIGVDVGVTGAFAVLDPDGSIVAVKSLPIMRHGSSSWIDGVELLSMVRPLRGSGAVAIVEKTHATPKIGVSTANSMGLTLGSVLATLQIAGVGIEMVMPLTWKRGLGLVAPKASDRERKHASLCRARMLFPKADLQRENDHGRAEALLIAHWGMLQRSQGSIAA